MATQTPTVINKFTQKANDALKVAASSALLIFSANKALSEQPLHTVSKQIPSPDALASGAQSITIPFKTLDGSINVKGDVSEEGVFSLTDMLVSQKINYLDSASNIVSFFVDSLENPLRFKIIEATKDSIKLAPLDSLAAWKEITLANNNAIKGVLTNSSPHFPVIDTNLSKWNAIIEKVEAKGMEDGSSVFNIKFERNSAFLTSDTLYLPFNQTYLNQEMVRGAVIGIKIINSLRFSRASYNYKQAGWQYPCFLFQDTLVGSSLDFKLAINDKENREYDNLFENGYMGGGFNGSFRPLRLIYPIVNPTYTWFKNDPPRVNMSNGYDGAFGENPKDCPDSVWFKGGSDPRIRSPTGDAINFFAFPAWGNSFIFRNGSPELGLQFYTFNLVQNGNSFTIKDSSFTIKEYYMKNGKLALRDIGTTPSFQNYFGINGEISSKDSITFMPNDAKYMAKLSFMSTNNYQKGKPYQRIKTELLYAYPYATAIDVPVDTSLYLKFNKLLDTSSINDNTIFLQSISGPAPDSTGIVYPGWISGTIKYNPQDSSLEFIPDNKLAFETKHKITISNILGIDKEPIDTTLDFTTIRDTSVGINDPYSSLARELLFPNPAENSTTLKIELEKGQAVELKLYDLFGNEKTVYYNKYMEKGEHNIPIDLNGLSAGTYLIRESRSGKTRKLIKR